MCAGGDGQSDQSGRPLLASNVPLRCVLAPLLVSLSLFAFPSLPFSVRRARGLIWRDKLTVKVDFPLRGLDLTHKHLKNAAAAAAAAPADTVDSAASASAAAVVGDAGSVDGSAAPASLTVAGGVPGVDPAVYDCFSVVNHFGSLSFGHYTAFSNHVAAQEPAAIEGSGSDEPPAGRWYHFDDDRVQEVAPTGVGGPAAYILFYRRRKTPGAAAVAAEAAASASGSGTALHAEKPAAPALGAAVSAPVPVSAVADTVD